MDTRTVNILSICSGIGGIELGLSAALGGRARTICYVENEISVCSILETAFSNGTLPAAPLWSNLRTFDPEPWRGKVDILAGGFPCQPHSVAGSKMGREDPRELSGEVLRIAAGLGYPTLFLENVPGILRFYWDNIRPSLQELGYRVAEGLFTASETGAPQKRQRLFILAHANSSGSSQNTRNYLDDSEHNGLTSTEEPRGTGLRTQFSSTREIEPEQPTRSSSGATRADKLAHADSDREIRDQSQYRKGRGIEQNGEELAHASGEGLERIRSAWEEEQEERPEAVPLPLYPPGPDELDKWAWLLERWPELSPTICKESRVQYEVSETECEFCSSPSRVSQEFSNEILLRAIGNSVIPSVAATGFKQLTDKLITNSPLSLRREGVVITKQENRIAVPNMPDD